jgi:hypothetical protein
VSVREQIPAAGAPATTGESARAGDPGKREPDSGMQLAQALARHVEAALSHLRQAANIAQAASTGPDASEYGLPEAALFRTAGDAAQDLDPRPAVTPAPVAPAPPAPVGTPGAGGTPPAARCPRLLAAWTADRRGRAAGR